MTLTLLTVTRAEPYALPFIAELEDVAGILDAELVIAADGPEAVRRLDQYHDNITLVRSDGYLESVLDRAVARCRDGYILRLDDDERLDDLALMWLHEREYEEADHWAFQRLNLWPDEASYITNLGMFPDPQTRLSVKAKSGGRHQIHDGSPYGTGRMAHGFIEHHKFLVRSQAEREAVVLGYERIQGGAGSLFMQYSLPEHFAAEIVTAKREKVAA